jgi:hypothetical protein
MFVPNAVVGPARNAVAVPPIAPRLLDLGVCRITPLTLFGTPIADAVAPFVRSADPVAGPAAIVAVGPAIAAKSGRSERSVGTSARCGRSGRSKRTRGSLRSEFRSKLRGCDGSRAVRLSRGDSARLRLSEFSARLTRRSSESLGFAKAGIAAEASRQNSINLRITRAYSLVQ